MVTWWAYVPPHYTVVYVPPLLEQGPRISLFSLGRKPEMPLNPPCRGHVLRSFSKILRDVLF